MYPDGVIFIFNDYFCPEYIQKFDMQRDLPKIDLPEAWIVGTGIGKELLTLYANYPVRLKCEMFVFCMGGEVEASVNLNRIVVRAHDVVLLTPESIFQIYRVEGEFKVYILGFSGEYIKNHDQGNSVLEAMYMVQGWPVVSLRQEGVEMLEEYFRFLLKMYRYFDTNVRKMFAANLFSDVHTAVKMLYRNKLSESGTLSKNEQLCRNFMLMVVRNYAKMRNVAWYASQLGVTQAYLCTTVKRVTGNTCIDIISSMVIMDAKSQLKLTELSVQAISDALNFANVSFFGKYFKRNVGMSPMEYRNNG